MTMEIKDIRGITEAIDDILENECYDIMDEFKDYQIKDIVTKIVRKMRFYKNHTIDCYVTSKDNEVHATLNGCADLDNTIAVIRVSNRFNGSFISWSQVEYGRTGVSESLTWIMEPHCLTDEVIKTTIEMINEAWYNSRQ